MPTAWKDLTKEERSARIKAGREAAKKSPADDMGARIKAAVDAAMATIRSSPIVTGAKDPKDMTPTELKAEHDRLQAALEALPFTGEALTGQREPGTKIGEGLTQEYVPHTRAWFEDVETRRLDRNYHNGKPAELKWPGYTMHDVIWQGTKAEIVGINGVFYGLLSGIPCKLPTPFYGVYMDSIRGLREHNDQFTPPVPSTNPGYFHVNISKSSGRPVAVLLGKGPLATQSERELGDAPVAQ